MPPSSHFTDVYRLRVALNHHKQGINNADAGTPRSVGLRSRSERKDPRKHQLPSRGLCSTHRVLQLRVSRSIGQPRFGDRPPVQPGPSSPAASRWLSGSLYSSVDPSPDASACGTGARLRGGARRPAPPQPSGKQPPQPSVASVPGLCPAPGTVRPGPEAGRGPVRRPLSRGGEETRGTRRRSRSW